MMISLIEIYYEQQKVKIFFPGSLGTFQILDIDFQNNPKMLISNMKRIICLHRSVC